ncbi:MAG: tetratricopeptide repeat protein [Deltaproteobacteria bacterium]|nr:tetratricopeptide repeat protein [Deltaproteobacteria bacterium]
MAEPPAASRTGKALLAALLLALAVSATFAAAVGNGFVNYDDDVYVTENVHLRQGLGPAGVAWAFSSSMASNWHPLTWLSHMLDYQLYGLRPWGHHLTSVVLHVGNALLVFALLLRLTGAMGRALVVAAIFGLHPLHVQSVAWVAERKDVLCALFFLLSLWAYAGYARHAGGRRKLSYGLSLLWFALGLLAKPMLVTLPAVLLLLDYWPLLRWQTMGVRRLLLEKVPFLLLSIASAIVTFCVQRAGGGMADLVQLPVGDRAQNLVVSYARYASKLLWPADLAVLYPFRGGWSPAEVIGSSLFLLAVTVAVVARRGRRPYLLVGWLWFVGMLVPVIGIVQVGQQTMADRYMYLPMLGLVLLATWGLVELAGERRRLARGLAVLAAGSTLGYALFTYREIGHWRDGETLFRRAVAVTGGSGTSHYKLGLALNEKGKLDEAYRELRLSLAAAPGSYAALAALGVVCKRQGKVDQAIAHLEAALGQNPGAAESHYQLGTALDKKGRFDEAIAAYERALGIDPGLADAHLGIGTVLGRKGRIPEAIARFERALAIDRANAPAYYNLGMAHAMLGDLEAAGAAFRKSLVLAPGNPDAHNNLGLVLVEQGRRGEAVAEFQEALRLKPSHERARHNLENVLGARPGARADDGHR